MILGQLFPPQGKASILLLSRGSSYLFTIRLAVYDFHVLYNIDRVEAGREFFGRNNSSGKVKHHIIFYQLSQKLFLGVIQQFRQNIFWGLIFRTN